MKDYYQILGVAPTASAKEIKSRYRYLSHAYHPDKFASAAHKKQAEEEFQRINEAYQVLSNPQQRVEYDRQRETPSDRGPKQAAPEPIVSPRILDFRFLRSGERRTRTFTVDNLGGLAAEINLSCSEEDSWFEISNVREASETDPWPLEVEVTANTHGLGNGQNYRGWIEVDLDGVIARVGVRVSVVPKPRASTSRSRRGAPPAPSTGPSRASTRRATTRPSATVVKPRSSRIGVLQAIRKPCLLGGAFAVVLSILAQIPCSGCLSTLLLLLLFVWVGRSAASRVGSASNFARGAGTGALASVIAALAGSIADALAVAVRISGGAQGPILADIPATDLQAFWELGIDPNLFVGFSGVVIEFAAWTALSMLVAAVLGAVGGVLQVARQRR